MKQRDLCVVDYIDRIHQLSLPRRHSRSKYAECALDISTGQVDKALKMRDVAA